MNGRDTMLPAFQASYAPPDEELAAGLLAGAARDRAAEGRIDARARRLVEAIRRKAGGLDAWWKRSERKRPDWAASTIF